MNQNIKVAEVFWSKVQRTSGCWLWLGPKDQDGYGIFSSTRLKVQRAHRAAWVLVNGSIPTGLCVLHSCDVPCCVNPDHLWLGSNLDNVKDRTNKGRSAKGAQNGHATKPECTPRGLKHGAYTKPESRRVGVLNGRAKLQPDDVRQIRVLFQQSGDKKAIADHFKITPQQVQHIVTGRQWRHVI